MMVIQRKPIIRPTQPDDGKKISELIQLAPFVHQHLDWRRASDWIGTMPFFVLEWNYQIIAALACPPDPEDTAWIRLFVVDSLVDVEEAWESLWTEARRHLGNREIIVAAIAFQKWFKNLVANSSFEHIVNVVLLQWNQQALTPCLNQNTVSIRDMNIGDIPAVYKIDNSAFNPPWRHSQEILELAYKNSSIATVAEVDKAIVGYQISTANASGGHLARLAVLPEWQGRGVGFCLVQSLLSIFNLWGTLKVTVNTQVNNYSSLALYRKTGFQTTNDVYPVYQIENG